MSGSASEALASGRVDLLHYIPRSGATGERFTMASLQQQANTNSSSSREGSAHNSPRTTPRGVGGTGAIGSTSSSPPKKVTPNKRGTAVAAGAGGGGGGGNNNIANPLPFASTSGGVGVSNSSGGGGIQRMSEPPDDDHDDDEEEDRYAQLSVPVSVAKAPVGLPAAYIATPPSSSSSAAAAAAGVASSDGKRGGGGGGIMARLFTSRGGDSPPSASSASASGAGRGKGRGGDSSTGNATIARSFGPSSGGSAAKRSDPHDSAAAHSGAVSRERARLEALRTGKWMAMLREWPQWMGNEGKRVKARNRCRKGIPESMRGAAWQVIVGSAAVREEAGGVGAYRRLLSLPLKGKGGSAPSSSLSSLSPPSGPKTKTTTSSSNSSGSGGLHSHGSGFSNVVSSNDAAAGGGSNGRSAAGGKKGVAASSGGGPTAASFTAKVHMRRNGTDVTPSVVQLFRGLQGASEGHATPEIIDTIERDINRTFPQFALFAEVGGLGE